MDGGLVGSIAIGRIGAASHPSGGEIKLHVLGTDGALVIERVAAGGRHLLPRTSRRRSRASGAWRTTTTSCWPTTSPRPSTTGGDTILDVRASHAIFATVEAALESCRTGQAVEVDRVPLEVSASRDSSHGQLRRGHPMTGREIIQALHDGRHVFASAIVGMSPLWPDLAKQTGIDFVFVDTEHIPLDRQTLSYMCQTYQALGPAAGRAHSVQRPVRGVQGARRRGGRHHRPVPGNGRAGARPRRRGEVAAAQGPAAARGAARPATRWSRSCATTWRSATATRS